MAVATAVTLTVAGACPPPHEQASSSANAALERLPVDRDDVGLNVVVRLIRRVVVGHDAFEPVPLRGVAVVAAGPEADGALLAHGVIARAGALAVERRHQRAR